MKWGVVAQWISYVLATPRDPGSKPGGGWKFICVLCFYMLCKRIVINKRAPIGANLLKKEVKNETNINKHYRKDL